MYSNTINNVIRTIMKECKITQQRMAIAIGKTRPTFVSSRLDTANMTFDKAIEMLNVCGYEVVVQKRKQGKRPDDQYLVIRSCEARDDDDAVDGKKNSGSDASVDGKKGGGKK